MFIGKLAVSFMVGMAFAILFLAPRICILASGLVAALGWLSYNLLHNVGVGFILAVFIASLLVGFLSEGFARIYKVPVTVFAISGIVPLVPGRLAYMTIHSLALGEYDQAVLLATETLMIAASVAAGIIVVSSVVRAIKTRGDLDVTGPSS